MRKSHTVLLSAAPLAALLVAFQTGQQGKPKEAGAPRGMPSADEVMQGWPEVSRAAAKAMMEKYGEPDGVTGTMLVWHDNAPWLQTIVYSTPVKHDFPMPHEDVLEQWIGYRVPADRFDEIAQYDGSVICERTKGVMSARCDKEAANFLALNLAHEIVKGTKTVDAARQQYADVIARMMKGDADPLTKELQFQPQAQAGDPDQPLATGSK